MVRKVLAEEEALEWKSEGGLEQGRRGRGTFQGKGKSYAKILWQQRAWHMPGTWKRPVWLGQGGGGGGGDGDGEKF